MLSSLQQLSNNSEGLSFIINLGGNSDNKLQLNISAAQARFIEINKYFNSKANDAVQVFSQEYPKAIKNLDNAIQKTYDLGLEIIQVQIEIICEQLISMGAYALNRERFIKKYIARKNLFEWGQLLEQISNRFDQFDIQAETQKAKRDIRKQSRGRLVGGGFGISGAAKGIAIAGAGNLATGLAHSMFNGVGNMRTDAKTREKKAKIFQSEDRKYEFSMEIWQSINNLKWPFIWVMQSELEQKIEDITSSSEEYERAKAILENIKAGNLPTDNLNQALNEVFRVMPNNLDFYQYLVRTFGDCNNEIERVALCFDCDDIIDYKAKLSFTKVNSLNIDSQLSDSAIVNQAWSILDYYGYSKSEDFSHTLIAQLIGKLIDKKIAVKPTSPEREFKNISEIGHLAQSGNDLDKELSNKVLARYYSVIDVSNKDKAKNEFYKLIEVHNNLRLNVDEQKIRERILHKAFEQLGIKKEKFTLTYDDYQNSYNKLKEISNSINAEDLFESLISSYRDDLKLEILSNTSNKLDMFSKELTVDEYSTKISQLKTVASELKVNQEFDELNKKIKNDLFSNSVSKLNFLSTSLTLDEYAEKSKKLEELAKQLELSKEFQDANVQSKNNILNAEARKLNLLSESLIYDEYMANIGKLQEVANILAVNSEFQKIKENAKDNVLINEIHSMDIASTDLSKKQFNQKLKELEDFANKIDNRDGFVDAKHLLIDEREEYLESQKKHVSVLLGLGILFMPYIFAWKTLEKGYSINARVISFLILIGICGPIIASSIDEYKKSKSNPETQSLVATNNTSSSLTSNDTNTTPSTDIKALLKIGKNENYKKVNIKGENYYKVTRENGNNEYYTLDGILVDSVTENNGQQQEEQNKKKLNESVLAESNVEIFMQNLTEQQINDFGGQCENSQNTDEGVECLSKLSEDVDNELNKIYNQIIEELSKEDKAILVKYERDWVKQKEEFCSESSKRYENANEQAGFISLCHGLIAKHRIDELNRAMSN